MTPTTKSVLLPSVPAVLGVCPGGAIKSGDRCLLGADSCHASGGTVVGTECVTSTPAPATTPSTPSTSTSTTTTPLPSTSPISLPFGGSVCPIGTETSGNRCLDTIGCVTSGGIVSGDQCVHNTPAPTSTTSSRSGATQTPVKVSPVNGKCPTGSHSIGTEDDGITPWCVEDNPSTGTPTTTTGAGTTPGASTNTSSTTSAPKQVEVPPLKSGSCPYGSYSVGSSGNAGQPGTGSTICISTPGATTTTQTGFHIDAYGDLSKDQNPDGTCGQGTEHRPGTDPKQCMVLVVLQNKDGTCINGWTHFPGADPESCYMSSAVSTPTSGGSGTTTTTNTGTGGGTTPMTTPMKTGGATTTTGTGTTSTTNPTTTTSKTSPTSPQSSTTVTNVINKNNNVIGGSSSVGSGAGAVVTTPSQTTNNNNFLTYLNTPDKITIRYPSTWTKTEFANNSSIPVIFNAPINGSTAAATTKTSLMVNINQLTPSSATPDSYTQQQINALTNSSVIKYTITDTNSKVLTPPAGITAYREISYNGIKNSAVNTQIPLKGTAIFFVNGNTGYSLLYLAKQTEYNPNLPIVQQMINSFQMNATNSGGGVGSGSGSSSGGAR